jgi:hypothetical protein
VYVGHTVQILNVTLYINRRRFQRFVGTCGNLQGIRKETEKGRINKEIK